MPFELFVALRYLLTRRKHSFISVISLFSVAGVALGVAALIIVLGVMNGFSTNLRDKILGINAHIIVSNASGPFSSYTQKAGQAESIPEVVGAMPFIYSEVMLSTPRGVKGAALRGIEPQKAPHVLTLSEDMTQGSLDSLQDDSALPGLVIGSGMAGQLGVSTGQTVNMLSPSGTKSAAGFTPRVKTFQIVGIFDTGMYEYDSSLAYTSIGAAQQILGFEEDLASGLEVRLQNVYAAEEVADRLREKLRGFPFVVQTWMDMNQSLFSALKLEKTAMGVILIMIVLVGSFSIITTLIMLVMEKKQDIAVLMSMGAKPKTIRNIFMWQGSIIGLVGTFLGFLFGISASLLLKRYQFIKLPPDVYYMDHLPVLLEPVDLSIIAVAAMLLCFCATLYPARQAAQIQPTDVLRYE
jgi:lipoprotein-releasing system permease protein